MKTDTQLQADVMQALKWDPSVTHQHIGVSAENGIVTLSGVVPSYIEKSSAERAAQRVSGVRAVVEKIEIKLLGAYDGDDQDIATAIVSQFKWNVQIPDHLIKASVENGWVDLSGTVAWDYQRVAAENCVRGLNGVSGVCNHITIKPNEIQPEEVKQSIEEALTREAIREAQRISVEIQGSKVILSGVVHSFTEVHDAKWAAWSAPGVTHVENNIRVEGS